MVGTAALVGGLGSLGGGLAGMFGGGSSQPQMQPNPIPAGVGVNALTGGGLQGITQLPQYNLGGAYMPAYETALSQYLQNPYGGGAIGAASQFGGAAQNIANQGFGNAAQIGGTVSPILQQAFDPQQALFQRTSGQVSDRELAALSAMGLGTTPVGAGAYGQTMSDFNLNWQNQQLQRMLQGVQGAEGAGSSALGLGQSALGLGTTGGMAPFQAYGQVAGTPLGAYGGAAQYGQQAAAIPQTGIGDWLSYLSASTGGQNAMTNLYGQQLAAQRQQFDQNKAFGQGIGAGLGGIAASPFGTGIGSWMQGLGGGGGGVATVYPNPNVPGGYAPGYA